MLNPIIITIIRLLKKIDRLYLGLIFWEIKKVSTEKNKSQIDAVFELKLTDEEKIVDVLVKEQSLEVIDLSKCQITEEIKTVLPSNYINMNFVAPFKVDGNTLHIAISDSSKLVLMRN